MKAYSTTTRRGNKHYDLTHRLYAAMYRIERSRHRWDWIDLVGLISLIVIVASLTASAIIKMGGA